MYVCGISVIFVVCPNTWHMPPYMCARSNAPLAPNHRLIQDDNVRDGFYQRWPALRDFHAYVLRNYFDGEFAVGLWNVYNRDMDQRTNNSVEGKVMFAYDIYGVLYDRNE